MGRARPLEPGPEPRTADPGPGPAAWARAQAPEAVPGPCERPVSFLFVCAYSTLIYLIPLRKTTDYRPAPIVFPISYEEFEGRSPP